MSTIVETAKPEEEIAPALQLLGPVLDKFVSISDQYEPLNDGTSNNVFISKSYDATSHFQTVTADIRSIYQVRKTCFFVSFLTLCRCSAWPASPSSSRSAPLRRRILRWPNCVDG